MRIDLSKLDLISLLIYTIVIVVLIVIIWAELKDVRCPDFRMKNCGPGMGNAYAAGRPKDGDSLKVLLQKLRTTARYDVNSITWRRVFIASIISAFVVSYIIKKRFPSGFHLASSFLVIYIVFYMMLTLFQKWVAVPALKQLDDIISRIKHNQSQSEGTGKKKYKSGESMSEGSLS